MRQNWEDLTEYAREYIEEQAYAELEESDSLGLFLEWLTASMHPDALRDYILEWAEKTEDGRKWMMEAITARAEELRDAGPERDDYEDR